LAESLRRQGRRKEGEAVARQFAAAWKAADTVRPDLRY
jgi:hypothetical protein